MAKKQQNTNPNESIVIDLNASLNTQNYALGNLIHQVEFDRVQELIAKDLEEAERYKNGQLKNTTRYQNTISILGSRGSGKSSFLLSLMESYRNGEDKDKGVTVLDLIDPTLIEEKGHIFLNIISQIQTLTEQKLKSIDCHPDSDRYCQKQCWEQRLEALANGLPSMEGVGPDLNSSFQDPEYIMHKGLQAVKAAKELERNFHIFVNESLKIIGKKAFMIVLDDIDVDFKKGWPVLETIRKYLTTPQIITLVSGDIDLFSKAIRKQQWKNFGKSLLVNEIDKISDEEEKREKQGQYNAMVTEMEGQYLQKVLPSVRWIRFKTLLEKINLYGDQFQVEWTKIGQENDKYKRELSKFYQDKLACFGIANKSQAKSYTDFILSLPLRTQIQLMSEMSRIDDTVADSLSKVDISDAFLSNLYEKNVEVDLARDMPKMINVVILKFLISHKLLANAYQLQPIETEVSTNGCLTALCLLLSKHISQNPFLIFDFIIRIGYVRNLLANGIVPYTNRDISSKLEPNLNDLCQKSQLFQDANLENITRNISAYIRGTLEKERESYLGDSVLFGLAEIQKKTEKYKKGRFDYEVGKYKKNLSSKALFSLIHFPLLVAQEVRKQDSLVIYSIFSLIGAIAEIVKCSDIDEIKNRFSEIAQIRSYTIPSFNAQNGYTNKKVLISIDEDDDDDDDDEKDQDQEKISAIIKYDNTLFEAIHIWKDAYTENEIKCSAVFLGKISTRFFSALESITMEKQTVSLGVQIHRKLIALFNAVLIEDVRESSLVIDTNINTNNAINSDTIFLKNIDKVKNIEDLQFSKWFFSCPLLLPFLNMTDKFVTFKSFFQSAKFMDKRTIISIKKGETNALMKNGEVNLLIKNPEDINILKDSEGINISIKAVAFWSNLFDNGLDQSCLFTILKNVKTKLTESGVEQKDSKKRNTKAKAKSGATVKAGQEPEAEAGAKANNSQSLSD